jgi:Glyoxalase-like domain
MSSSWRRRRRSHDRRRKVPDVIRLRQVALVGRELDPVVEEICDRFGLRVCYRDPGIASFGLHNALMTIGDQFLEVVAPIENGTTAGRLLDRRRGNGGYMAIFEVDDFDERLTLLDKLGIRAVWNVDRPDIRARHLHPRDIGGAIVSIDQPVPNGSWPWAGPWTAHADTGVVTAIAGVTIGATDPAAMRARWADARLDHAVRFVPASDRGEGIDGVDLVAADRSRAGEPATIGGVEFRLV